MDLRAVRSYFWKLYKDVRLFYGYRCSKEEQKVSEKFCPRAAA